MFRNDRVLLYDVEPWAGLGFGVPNFGENVGTLSMPIHGLVDEIGRNQLFIMTHIDATRWQPPSINTVKRMCKMLMRINSVLSSRQEVYSRDRLEPGHSSPAQEIFLIHPVPYFNVDQPLVRNRWLREYNQLTMIALANAMQHSDNNIPLTITSEFAAAVWQYFKRLQVLIATELLLLDRATAEADGFVFTDAHYQTYDPMKVIVNIEPQDWPVPVQQLPTEDDLKPLATGITATTIKGLLKEWPEGDTSGLGTSAPSGASPGVISAPSV